MEYSMCRCIPIPVDPHFTYTRKIFRASISTGTEKVESSRFLRNAKRSKKLVKAMCTQKSNSLFAFCLSSKSPTSFRFAHCFFVGGSGSSSSEISSEKEAEFLLVSLLERYIHNKASMMISGTYIRSAAHQATSLYDSCTTVALRVCHGLCAPTSLAVLDIDGAYNRSSSPI
jgi:hypothetical protein